MFLPELRGGVSGSESDPSSEGGVEGRDMGGVGGDGGRGKDGCGLDGGTPGGVERLRMCPRSSSLSYVFISMSLIAVR